MSHLLELVKQLISCHSVTPVDAGCQEMISQRLQKLGFHIEHMPFEHVNNLWARYGSNAPLIVFAGHTDVVPSGPLDAWHTDPFEPTIRGDMLYGRGAADMKGGLAAMVIAVENFLQKNPNFPGSIAFLITSDEEGPAIHGTKKVVDTLMQRDEKIDYCIVGEASSEQKVGDQIRVGRRGSLCGKLIIQGQQGHVAFPHLAKNPIHLATKSLYELTSKMWDAGNEFFPPTSFQISNIHAGNGVLNIIPSSLEILFNFRFSTASTVDDLRCHLTDILENNGVDFDLHLSPSAHPFLSKQGRLTKTAQEVIQELVALDPVLSTGGGTSDGRFIALTGAEIIELGPCNRTVHQANESVNIKELEMLTRMYERILEKIF